MRTYKIKILVVVMVLLVITYIPTLAIVVSAKYNLNIDKNIMNFFAGWELGYRILFSLETYKSFDVITKALKVAFDDIKVLLGFIGGVISFVIYLTALIWLVIKLFITIFKLRVLTFLMLIIALIGLIMVPIMANINSIYKNIGQDAAKQLKELISKLGNTLPLIPYPIAIGGLLISIITGKLTKI